MNSEIQVNLFLFRRFTPGVVVLLTLADLALLLDVPGVQRRPLLVLHGGSFVEVLGEVGLVQSSGLHHLPLREVVLLHVAFHNFSNMPGILSVTEMTYVMISTAVVKSIDKYQH